MKLILSKKDVCEMQEMALIKPESQYTDESLAEGVNNLTNFLGDFMCSEDAVKLALRKCKLNIEDAIFMVTNPD